MTPEQMEATHAAAFTQARAWRAAEFAALLERPGGFVVGDARCFALGSVVAGEAELLTIATHPDHQRQGHALAVMRAWMAEAVARGAEVAFLEVAEDNTPARALYERCGFAEAGRRRGYYRRSDGGRVDALVLRRLLDPRAGGAS